MSEQRVIEFKVTSWVIAYCAWLDTSPNWGPDKNIMQMDVLDAFRAGFEAGQKAGTNA